MLDYILFGTDWMLQGLRLRPHLYALVVKLVPVAMVTPGVNTPQKRRRTRFSLKTPGLCFNLDRQKRPGPLPDWFLPWSLIGHTLITWPISVFSRTLKHCFIICLCLWLHSLTYSYTWADERSEDLKEDGTGDGTGDGRFPSVNPPTPRSLFSAHNNGLHAWLSHQSSERLSALTLLILTDRDMELCSVELSRTQ